VAGSVLAGGWDTVKNADRFVVLDAGRDIDTVARDVLAAVRIR